jgi:hydrogenase nickel incorporation protein HypB
MTERILVVENILSANDRLAEENRARIDAAGVFSINLMASPGAGKTSLIEKTLPLLNDKLRVAVVDGDIATSFDADRAAAAGAQASIQVNTGGECHLDAVMLHGALNQLNLTQFDLLMVENVGNLVCPAEFRLGTHKSVDALVINKVDLLPYIDFDMDFFRRGVEALNPGVITFPLSCRTGEGIDAWINWLIENS